MKIFFIVLFSFMACSKTPEPVEPKRDMTTMQLAWHATQTAEGRISLNESFFVLHGGTKELKQMEATISGTRTHNFSDGNLLIHDDFSSVKILKSLNMPKLKSSLTSLSVKFSPKGVKSDISVKLPSDPYKLNQFIKPLYQFIHLLPKNSDGSLKKIKTGLFWTFNDEVEKVVSRTKVTMYRKFNFTIKKVVHTGQLHLAYIKANVISTSKKAINLGGFTVELVGRGTFEGEFSLDRGVWTHLNGREIVGWAGTYMKKGYKKPVTTGYRQEFKLNLYLTEN